MGNEKQKKGTELPKKLLEITKAFLQDSYTWLPLAPHSQLGHLHQNLPLLETIGTRCSRKVCFLHEMGPLTPVFIPPITFVDS